MKYGYFDDEKREYVIQTPKTPYPWINYLGTNEFFSIISQQSGGYCFSKDARLRRILRYRFNNVPTDVGGRYFYIRDEQDCWTPSYMPMKKDLDFFECRHGLGYTKITGERKGVRSTTTSFVPINHAAEVHRVVLENTSSQTKNIKLFSYVEFCLWNAHDDGTNLQRNLSTGEVEVENNTVYHKTEYRERRNHFAFYHSSEDIVGFDTDRESFLGLYNHAGEPTVVLEGQSKNSVASGWAPIASHCLEIYLNPGEKKDCIFLLGYVENPEDEKWEMPGVINKNRAKEMIQSMATPQKVEEALLELQEYWGNLLSQFSVQSNDEKLNRMVNIWNPYQCMVTFNMSRSASYFETGIGRGMGFRDSNQDLLGFVHLIPERARERILDIAATQFNDGSAYHQYQPLTKRGNNDIGSGFNDDPLWLIAGVSAYTRETGEYGILDERVPFDNNPDNSDTLFGHLTRSFNHVIEHRGPHGLPLIGRADWNDCLNLNCFSKQPDEPYQTTENVEGGVAESVFIAGMFVLYGKEYAELAKIRGLTEEARRAESEVTAMEEAVKQHGFDGNWFLRAYDYYGNKIGSSECQEGQIFIEPQGFCTMAGIGVEEGLAEKALDSVKERLDSKYGIMLQQPAYKTYHCELGEISSYPPGYKENAGIFCHNNPWVMIGETMIGRGDRAFEYYKKITPAYIEDISDIHRMEPYCYSQMIAGRDAKKHGEAKNSWLTGTAAWNFVAISQHMLGIRPEHEGLKVAPCISKEIDQFTITRFCRGVEYRIHVQNKTGGKVIRLTVDGKKIDGTLVPYSETGSIVNVECEA